MTLIRPISEVLAEFSASLTGESVSLGKILEVFHERGFGFLLLLFAFPMALPLPVPPGINILLASPLVILTAQQAMGRHTIWMPASWHAKSVSREKVQGLTRAAIPWMQKLEFLSRPRFGFITRGVFSNLIGACGLVMALTVMIPVPLTNTVPSLGIALMALGTIMRDGLAVLAGVAVGLTWIAILVFAVAFLGSEGLDAVKDIIKSIFQG